jgi:hypothetical protein
MAKQNYAEAVGSLSFFQSFYKKRKDWSSDWNLQKNDFMLVTPFEDMDSVSANCKERRMKRGERSTNTHDPDTGVGKLVNIAIVFLRLKDRSRSVFRGLCTS